MALALRSAVSQDNFDLTPPEVRRARRIRQWLLLFSPLIVGLIAVLVLTAPPAIRAIKGWHSRRLAQQAFILLGQERWNEAGAKARDAYQLSVNEPQTWRAIARFLSRGGQNANALEWWSKLQNSNRLTLEDRRDYAAAALAAGETTLAEAQIKVLLAQRSGVSERDILLNSQLAAQSGDVIAALDGVQQSMVKGHLHPRDLLDSAVLVFAIAPIEAPAYAEAWARLVRPARDPTNPVSLDALVLLARHPSPLKATTDQLQGRAINTGSPAIMPPEEIAVALEKHPKARPYHQMLAVELRARQKPEKEAEYMTMAIGRFANGDDDAVAALATWLQSHKQYEAALQVLPLNRALQRRDLFLQYLDALAMLGRWREISVLLTSDRFPLDSISQHMYLASARTYLGESAAAANEWQRALGAADTPEKCLTLGAYAERGRAWQTADAAYIRAVTFAPNNRSIRARQLRAAELSGQTLKAAVVAADIVQKWPADEMARDEAAYLRLLLGVSGAPVETILREAEAFALREPWNWNARRTQALACLRLGRISAALDAFSARRPTGAEPAGALAVWAVAMGANGWKDDAAIAAENLAGASLLPEERALIAPLLGAETEIGMGKASN